MDISRGIQAANLSQERVKEIRNQIPDSRTRFLMPEKPNKNSKIKPDSYKYNN